MRWMFISLVLLNVLYFSWHQYLNQKADPMGKPAPYAAETGLKTLTLLSEQPPSRSE